MLFEPKSLPIFSILCSSMLPSSAHKVKWLSWSISVLVPKKKVAW